MASEFQYLTTVTCPVCGAIFDEIHHPTPEPHWQSIAMLANDGRKMHRDQSPQCERDQRWVMGWKTNTRHLAQN